MNKYIGSFVALIALTILPASAQSVPAFSCAPYSDAPVLRAGGRAELLGELRVECTGGTGTYTSDITLSLNRNYSGRLTNASTNTTEALLIVGDPATPTLGANVYQGTFQTPNALKFSGVRLPAPGLGKLIVRLVNVRVDAGTAVSDSLEGNDVLGFISASNIPFNNPQQTLGVVGYGHRFQLTDAAGVPVSALNFNGAAVANYRVRFDEAFQRAFRKRNTATTVADPAALASQAEYGREYATETGFYLPALNAGDAGLATYGTRLMASFTNIPSGVSLSAGVQPATGSSASIQARLISVDADGSGAYNAISPSGDGTAPLSISGGSARAVWEVLSSDPAVLETLQFNIVATATSGAVGSAGVSGQFAVVNSLGTPDLISPLPRFSPPVPSASGCGANCLSVPSNLAVVYTLSDPAPAPLVIPIRSTGAPLSFQIGVTSGGITGTGLAPPDGSWISVSASSGVTPAAISATINPAGLAPGRYLAQMSVTAGRFTERINVVLDVKSNSTGSLGSYCVGASGVPPTVRSTGLTERLADLVLTCVAPSSSVTTDLRVTLDTKITSRPNDLLLLVNEPYPFEQALGVNVFRGERVSDTQVIFRNAVVPISADGNILRFTNIFADVSRIGLSGSNVPAQVNAVVRASALPLESGRVPVAFIQPGSSFRILNAAGAEVSTLAAAGNGKLSFKEGFASSYKARNIGTSPATPNSLIAQNNPGAIYNTETGFYNPALPPGSGTDMGLASQGTRLIARFSNVPAGVGISVSTTEIGSATLKAQLVQTDLNGAGAFLSIAGTYAPVSIANGSGVAVWEILTADPFTAQTIEFGLQVTGTVPANASVEGLLGPLSTVNVASASSPLPRFSTANVSIPVCPSFPCLFGPASVSLTSNGSAIASTTVSIQSDADPVPFTVADPSVPWLTLQLASGVTPGQFTVYANPAGLAAGTYTTNLIVNSLSIPVTFNVLAAGPAALLLPVESLRISFNAGTTPAPQTVSISGTTGLAWQAGANVPWLQLAPQSGTVPSAPSLSILASALPIGEYDGIVTVTASGATPVYLKVHASVTPASSGYSITGTINPPRAGITVTLSGAESRTATTAANGTYAITGLTTGGPYTVTPTFTGLTFSPASRSYTTIPSAQIADFNSASLGAPPQLISSTPATPFGSPQTFQIRAGDADGAANISRVYFVVNDTAAAAAGTCHGYYDRLANAFFLYNDALTSTLGPLTPGAAATLQNTQCQLLGATSTAAVVTGTEIAFNLSLSLKAPFANSPRNLYLWVQDNNGNGTGWLPGAVWSPLGSNPPTLVSASIFANTETVAFKPADPDNNLARAYFVLNTSPTVQTNGCHGFYDYTANAFFLYNDALTAFVDENSSCAIVRSSSFKDSSGQIQLALVRKGSLGATKMYLWIIDATNLGTGWLDPALNFPLRVNQPPTITNGTPATANSLTQQFSAVIDDATGLPDISRVYFLVNPNTSIPQNSCHGLYERATGATFLYNDALTSASSTTLENSQCRIQSVTATPGSTSLTLAITITRKGAYTNAAENVYLWAVDAAGNGTGWVQTASWTNGGNTPPTVIAPNPAIVSGTPVSFTMTARDADGASDLARLYFLFNPNSTIPQATCHGFYDKAANAVFLYNDTLSALLGPLTPGAAQIIQNSQCAVNGAATQVTATATDVVLTLNLTIKTTVASNAYLWAIDKQNNGTGWVQTAAWTPPAGNSPPSIVNRQDGYSGSPSTVTFVASDVNGYADIQRLYFLINADTNIPQNTCHGYYDRTANALFLYNDSLSAVAPNLQNSQCGIDAASLRITTSTDAKDLILTFNMSLKAPFANVSKNVYLWAVDSQNAGTGWMQTGQWLVNQNLAPTVSAASPSALFNAGVPNSITFPVADSDGNGNIARIYYLIADSPTVTANSCHGFYDRANGGLYLYNDSLTTLLGPGVSQNSQCRVTGNGTLSRSTPTALSLTFPIEILSGSYLASPKKIYIWAVDQQGNGSGWVQVATWN